MKDWDSLRWIEALAATGSLSSAAREVDADQSTLSRKLQSFEVNERVRLFTRKGGRYVPTDIGRVYITAAKTMKSAADSLSRSLSGRSAITVTSLESFFSAYLLKHVHEYPEKLAFLEADRTFNLSAREAEVAIRFRKPGKGNYVVRKLAVLGYSVYCGKQFFHSIPKNTKEYEWVRLNRDYHSSAPEAHWLNKNIRDDKVRFEASSYLQIATLLKTGGFVGILPCFIGNTDKLLTSLGPPLLFYPLWLVTHADVGKTSPVRQFKEWLILRTQKDEKLFQGQ